jgi:hypothetical protein
MYPYTFRDIHLGFLKVLVIFYGEWREQSCAMLRTMWYRETSRASRHFYYFMIILWALKAHVFPCYVLFG